MTPPDPNARSDSPDEWAFREGELVAGRYRIVKPLARGAFGEVHAARETEHEHRIALKILQTDSVERDPKAVARMRQEAEILRALDHPNLVQVHDIGTTEGHEFMVMELLEGDSLGPLIANGELAEPETIRPVAVQILSALDAMHDRGVQHRDIKPDNIILLGRGRDEPTVKLVDFGIAKARDFLDGDHEHTLVETKGNEFVGTPQYASPEQALGDPVGPSGDLFSLGLVLAEWMTGTPRIDRAEHRGAVSLLIQPDPIDVSDCPSAWQPWLEKMIAKRPEDRYSTASDALEGLPGDGDPVDKLRTKRTRVDTGERPAPEASLEVGPADAPHDESSSVERVGSPGDPMEPTDIRSQPPTSPEPTPGDEEDDARHAELETTAANSEPSSAPTAKSTGGPGEASDRPSPLSDIPQTSADSDQGLDRSTLFWTIASALFFTASLALFLYTLLTS